MRRGRRRIPLVLCLVVGLLVALPATAVQYVSATDPTCGGQSPCHTDIQSAVNAATPGEEVRVATGNYTGVAPVTVGSITYDQVVIITDSLTLQGGYTTSNWTTPDPAANPAFIDAEGNGRCVSVVGSGSETVNVGGFILTNGDYTGLGNPDGVGQEECPRTGSDCGGGLYAYMVTLHLSDCIVRGNVVSTTRPYGDGGGVFLWKTEAGTTVDSTTFSFNSSDSSGGEGGGMKLTLTDNVTITDCDFHGNSASVNGGGLSLFQPWGLVVVEDTMFNENTIQSSGAGGVSAGLTFQGPALRLDRVILRRSQGYHNDGAALFIKKQGSGVSEVELTNLIMAHNTMSYPGTYDPVVGLEGGSAGDLQVVAKHLTWAGHLGMSALRATQSSSGQAVSVTLTNVLIDTAENAFVGDETAGEITITHTNTLHHNVSALEVIEAGSPTFTDVGSFTGDPWLTADGHIGASASAAIDSGVDSAVADDVDCETRPYAAGYDVGADEYYGIFADDFESGNMSAWSAAVP